MSLHEKPIPSNQLRITAHREEFYDEREPPLALGNRICLNSGGPEMLVVDISEGKVVAAWKSDANIQEHVFPCFCVHRVRN